MANVTVLARDVRNSNRRNKLLHLSKRRLIYWILADPVIQSAIIHNVFVILVKTARFVPFTF